MASKLLNEITAFMTVVVDTTDTDYNYTGFTYKFGADTSDEIWLIAKERKTNTANTQGTIVYSANPFLQDKTLVFNQAFDDRSTVVYNNDVDIED